MTHADGVDSEPSAERVRTSTGRESLSILLLLVGGFLLGVGWIIGVVMLWTSTVWNRRDKLIGTFLLPGGLLPLFFLLRAVADTSGSTTKVCGGVGGIDPSVCTYTSTHSGLTAPVGVPLLVAALVIPIATAIHLSRRRIPISDVAV